MTQRIYASRSFDPKDEAVWTAISRALSDKALASKFDFEVLDSSAPEAHQLYERISADINSSDIVLAIFTRRFALEDGKSYAPPPYVVGEAGLGLGRGKRLVMLVEEGIPRNTLGIAEAPNTIWLTFRRSDLSKAAYQPTLIKFLESALDQTGFQQTHSHRFERYEVIHSVYPNGYVMVHYKVMLEVLQNEPRPHHFTVHPAPGAKSRLPTTRALILAGTKSPCPYPDTPFLAFGAPDPSVTFAPAEPSPDWLGRGAVRCFEVRFPHKGIFKYQYIIGAAGGFDPEREIESSRIHLSGTLAPRLSLTLRVHKGVGSRLNPVMVPVPGDRYLNRGTGTRKERDDVLRPFCSLGKPAGVDNTETTPLFRCYRWDGPVAPDHDMLLLF